MRIIGGKFRNRLLASPKGAQTRPTAGQLRESLFNICQSYVDGARFLDLFAGSGAMGMEALSRGASQATFIEKDKLAVACIRKNIEMLQIKEQSAVLAVDILNGLKYLSKQQQEFDIIYSDPPYDREYNKQILAFIDEGNLLAPSGILFLEDPIEAPTESENLNRLCLKNSRRLGRAVLQQFVYK